jgi:hypothetical protein
MDPERQVHAKSVVPKGLVWSSACSKQKSGPDHIKTGVEGGEFFIRLNFHSWHDLLFKAIYFTD